MGGKSNKKFHQNNDSIESVDESPSSSLLTQQSKALLIDTDLKWFELKEKLVSKIKKLEKYEKMDVSILYKEAEELYKLEKENYYENRIKGANKQEFNWIETVLSKGTLLDKISANITLIQDSSVHNLTCLNNLINIVNPKVKRECLLAMGNLKELFLADLLLEETKLASFHLNTKYIIKLENFHKNNEESILSRKKMLIIAYFEDNLLRAYRKFIETIDKATHDSVDAVKDKAVTVLFELLVNSSEQEQFILEKLVNKLGDPTPKRASHVVYLLQKLVNEKHPAMKEVVINEVERLLYRPNILIKAQYYSFCFFNMIILNNCEVKVANKLIKLYFDFFTKCIKSGEVNTKLMSALLTGVSRCYPYSNLENQFLANHIDTLYKMVHYVDNNIAIQAMALIFNVINQNDSGSISDRFYSLLYRTLLEFNIEHCTKKAIYINLLYRAMKKDPITKRVRAFVKRLLEVSLNQSARVASGILILISQIRKLKPEVFENFSQKTVISKNVSIDDDEEEDENDGEKFNDDNGEEEEEEEKDEYADSTVTKSKSENFNKKGENQINESNISGKKVKPSWLHTKNLLFTKIANNKPGDKKNKTILTLIDKERQCRNPLYSQTDSEPFWELSTFSKHYHPSLSLFAENILSSKNIEYDGDPLLDFTVKNFLDRFVFRNPKRTDKNDQNKLKHNQDVFRREQVTSVNSSLIDKQVKNFSEDKIPLQQRFIFKYLKHREQMAKEADDDNASVNSEDFEKLLEHYEPGFEDDLVTDISSSKKRRFDGSDIDEDDDDDDDDDEHNEIDDDEEVNYDDDEDFKEAFDDLDDELAEAFANNQDNDAIEMINDDDDEDEQMIKKHKTNNSKRDKSLNALFASADEFSELLSKYEEDDGEDDDDDDVGTMNDNDEDDGEEEGFEKNPKRRRNFKGKRFKGNKKSKSGYKRPIKKIK